MLFYSSKRQEAHAAACLCHDETHSPRYEGEDASRRGRHSHFDVQFIEVQGRSERLAVIPESVFRVFEEIMMRDNKQQPRLRSAADLPASVQQQLDQGISPVRAIRQWRKLSAARLARLVGVSASMLSQLEVHGKTGTAETFLRISNVLDVPMEILIPRRHDMRLAKHIGEPENRSPNVSTG